MYKRNKHLYTPTILGTCQLCNDNGINLMKIWWYDNNCEWNLPNLQLKRFRICHTWKLRCHTLTTTSHKFYLWSVSVNWPIYWNRECQIFIIITKNSINFAHQIWQKKFVRGHSKGKKTAIVCKLIEVHCIVTIRTPLLQISADCNICSTNINLLCIELE